MKFSIFHYSFSIELVVTTKVFSEENTEKSFYQDTRVNRGRSDSILPQRDMAVGTFYGITMKKKKRKISKESTVGVAR